MRVGSASVCLCLSVMALGMPAMPGRIPGDRLVANLSERLKVEPGNAAIYYLIGRAHYATFSRAVESDGSKKGEVEILEFENSLPEFYSLPGNIYPWDSKTAVKDTPATRRHIGEAIRNLRLALNMTEKPTKATKVYAQADLAHLTLACSFDSGALLASKIKLEAPFEHLNTTDLWRAKAADEYLLAFQASISQDLRTGEQPIFGLQTLVAFEAGKSYLRLRPKSTQSASVKAGIEHLIKLPPCRAVTPLVLDLSGAKPLAELLDNTLNVKFDLDGSGRSQAYTWVKPTTGFLVWDPLKEGRITSGRQLFGNATWWMLWPNAFAALDALDDNHDGWLTGRELKGLAIWFDRNSNGKCDPGEVVPIEQTPITALRTSYDSKSGTSLVSTLGLRLRDGRTLPTYDWVVSSTQAQ